MLAPDGARARGRGRPLLGRNPTYRGLWWAQTGSWFGDYVNNVAIAAATLALTHSAAAMGLVLLCRGLPGLVIGPLAGPLIDRLPRQRVMVVTDLVRAVLALGFVVALADRRVWVLYAASLLLGAGGALFSPAQTAAVAEVVGRGDLVEANALLTRAAGAVAVVGAVTGGVFVGAIGTDAAFGLNALSYLWSAACIATVRWPSPGVGTDPPPGSYVTRLAEGWRVLAGSPVAVAALVCGTAFALTAGPYFVAPPVLGDLVYRLGAFGVSALYAADGLGFVVASIVVPRLAGAGAPERSRRLYGAAFVVQAVFLCALCLTGRLWQGMAAIFVSQVASGTILTLTPSFLQAHTPGPYHGRVFAVQGAVTGAAWQGSIALSGVLMARLGVASVGPPIGVVCLVAAVCWLVLARNRPLTAAAGPS